MEDSTLVLTALTHSSWKHEHGGEDNERLEFLGDAVLQLCASELLYRAAVEDEGAMTFRRQDLVNTETLAALARDEGLIGRIRAGRGTNKDEDKLLAGVWEALLAALYLEQGLDAAMERVREKVMPRLKAGAARRDPISRLQEHFQQTQDGLIPSYPDVDRQGPDHAPVFTVNAVVDGRILAQGRGPNKKEAKKDAARNALRELGLDD